MVNFIFSIIRAGFYYLFVSLLVCLFMECRPTTIQGLLWSLSVVVDGERPDMRSVTMKNLAEPFTKELFAHCFFVFF